MFLDHDLSQIAYFQDIYRKLHFLYIHGKFHIFIDIYPKLNAPFGIYSKIQAKNCCLCTLAVELYALHFACELMFCTPHGHTSLCIHIPPPIETTISIPWHQSECAKQSSPPISLFSVKNLSAKEYYFLIGLKLGTLTKISHISFILVPVWNKMF